jgi:hypothetical protein
MTSAGLTAARAAPAKSHEALEFRAIYALVFPFFLIAALIARLLPWRRRISGGEGKSHRSLMCEARAAAGAALAFAFMG